MNSIDWSTLGDAEDVSAIETWIEAGIAMVTIVFTDGETMSMPMTKAEARMQAGRCFGPALLTEISENGVSYRWTRLPHRK